MRVPEEKYGACGKLSKEFNITNGVRWDGVLAPTLFNPFLDAVVYSTIAEFPGCGLWILFNKDAE